MGALTRDIFERNAYRTLGLGGSATQAEIDAAARRMRLWPDPSRIPPTPWDQPAWGAVPRTRADIEQAVARLSDPRSRVEDRFRWYVGRPAASANADSPVARHDAAVAALHAAVFRDAFDPATWSDAAARFQALILSTDWTDAHLALEESGEFEKRVDPHEVRAAAATLRASVTAAFAERALRALEAGDPAAFEHARATLSGLDEPRRVELANSIEDTIEVRRREADTALRDKLRTRDGSPWDYYDPNRSATEAASAEFDRQIAPLLDALAAVAPADADRLVRVRSSVARYVILIALGWEWSNRWRTAQQTLERALKLAAGSVVELQAQTDLARVRPKAELERQTEQDLLEHQRRTEREKAAATAYDAAKRRAQFRVKIFSVVAAVILLVLWFAFQSQSPSDSGTSPAPTVDLSSLRAPLPGVDAPAPRAGTDAEKLELLRRRLESTYSTTTPATLPAEDVGESVREP